MPELAEPPPVTTLPKDMPEVPTTPEARKSVANMFLGKAAPKVEAKIEPPKEELPKEEKKTEPPKEEKKAEPVHSDKEVNMANLRKAREEAEASLKQRQKEYDDLKSEYEEYKKKPLLSDEHTQKLTAAEKERDDYRKIVQTASLERDPAFIAKYKTQINAQATAMYDHLLASGATKEDALRAVNQWDEQYFAQQFESMDPVHKVKFQGAWQQAEALEAQRRAELNNAETTWQQQQQLAQKAQQEQQEQHSTWLKSERDALLKEMFAVEGLRDNQEMQQSIRGAVDASFNFDPKRFMQAVANEFAFSKAVLQKDEAIKDLNTKLEEQAKKLEEQEQFITKARGGIPRVQPTGSKEQAAPDRKAIGQSFLNPAVNAG